jgi:hypothetical protein
MTTPQGRYRIEERGRRLVTIDTVTGKEVSNLQGSAGIEDVSSRPAPVSLGSAPVRTLDKAKPPSQGGDRQVRPLAQPRAIPDLELPSLDSLGRSGRQSLVAAGAILMGLMLFATGLWALLLLALIFSQDVRRLAFSTAPAYVRAFISGGAQR